MKTTAKQFTTYGNIAIVQVQAEPQTSFSFSPGAPEIRKGGLVITESTTGGIVGKLRAENLTDSYLLLTDADVLAGAKQNRIINKSILLAPHSVTDLGVSCVERLRWHFTEKDFRHPNSVADPDLRREKAAAMRMNIEDPYLVQDKVWRHVGDKLRKSGISSDTESYVKYLQQSMEKTASAFPECEAEKACTGIAVLTGKKVTCIDLFGSEEVYRHYFPFLRDSAFRMADAASKTDTMDKHEAFFRTLETIDEFLALPKSADEGYRGAGVMKSVENKNLVGYELAFKVELVHDAVFVL